MVRTKKHLNFSCNNNNGSILIKCKHSNGSNWKNSIIPQDLIKTSTIDLLFNTAIRETLEETKVKIKNLQLVAHRHIFNANPKALDSKFPHPGNLLHFLTTKNTKDSYMCYFYAEIDEIMYFKTEEHETGAIDRGFFEKEEALKMETIYLKHPTIFNHIINKFEWKNMRTCVFFN